MASEASSLGRGGASSRFEGDRGRGYGSSGVGRRSTATDSSPAPRFARTAVRLEHRGGRQPAACSLDAVRRSLVVLLALVALAAAGCGGDDQAQNVLTIPSDGRFAATKVPVEPATEARCRREADSFSRAAKSFLIPYPSDADVYRVLARVQFTAFEAHQCDLEILREAVSRRLTPKQLREVLAFFGFLGDVGRQLAPEAQR
jgi:hypothetical protein